MRAKTIDGVTRPLASGPDLQLLDRVTDLLLLYRQYESREELWESAEVALAGIRAIAARCRAMSQAQAPADMFKEGSAAKKA